MLQVQKYLNEFKENGIGQLKDGLGIEATFSKTDPLVILNYNQLESPRRHPIVRECRGLTLEMNSWNVAARSFERFFNVDECKDLQADFNWQNFTCQEKEDGSMMLLYHYRDRWRVNTMASFAQGEIKTGVEKSWEEVFFSAFNMDALKGLPNYLTWVFELCSPFNQVVRRYPKPTLYLLSAVHNESGIEPPNELLDAVATKMGVQRPRRHGFYQLDQVMDFLAQHPEPTFEGLVLCDDKHRRIKAKTKSYTALHHVHDNGNIFMEKRLLPVVLKGQQYEVLAYWPEATEKVLGVVEKLFGQEGRMMAVWEVARGIEDRKEFASYVTKWTPLCSVLFEARDSGKDPRELFRGERVEHLMGKRFFNRKARGQYGQSAVA